MRSKDWKICDECGRKMKRFHIVKDQILCFNCYRSKVTMISIGGARPLSLEECLNKTYNIGFRMSKDYVLGGVISTPRALVGKKVKLVLVEDSNE
jgi:hypothetical protein